MTPRISQQRLPIGIDAKTGECIWLPLSTLFTHVEILGPPGCGKTRMLLWIFQCLCHFQNATIFMFSPKGQLCQMAEHWAMAHGFSSRLTLINPGRKPVIGYNPLSPSEIPVSTHAKGVREAIRSGWGQSSFDQTPQMARLLYLALAVARSLEMSLDQSVALLRTGVRGSNLRTQCASRLNDRFLRDSLLWFESLSERRQEEIAASSMARLEAFVGDPEIRPMLVKSNCFSVADAIKDKQIVLIDLQIGRPLRVDDVKLLGRFIVNDVIGQAFSRGSQTEPIFLIIDEVPYFATNDLCQVLDMGRELGLCGIFAHQYLSQLQLEDQTGLLYESMIACARTKVMFGGLSTPDLDLLAKETMIDRFNPFVVKDEIKRLEIEPVETRREIITTGKNRSVSRTNNESTSEAESQAEAQGRSIQRGHGASQGGGSSISHSSTTSQARSSGEISTAAVTNLIQADGMMLPVSAVESLGASAAEVTGSSETDSNTQSHNWSESSFESEGEQTVRQRVKTRGLSKGVSAGQSSGDSESRTSAPFYEYRKSVVASSRTFWSLEEFWTSCIQNLKLQLRGHFTIKVPDASAEFLKVPFVQTPWISNRVKTSGLARIFSRPCYAEEVAPKSSVSSGAMLDFESPPKRLPAPKANVFDAIADDPIGRE